MKLFNILILSFFYIPRRAARPAILNWIPACSFLSNIQNTHTYLFAAIRTERHVLSIGNQVRTRTPSFQQIQLICSSNVHTHALLRESSFAEYVADIPYLLHALKKSNLFLRPPTIILYINNNRVHNVATHQQTSSGLEQANTSGYSVPIYFIFLSFQTDIRTASVIVFVFYVSAAAARYLDWHS